MLNPTSLLADALGRNLAETYRRIYGDREPHIAARPRRSRPARHRAHRQQRRALSRLRAHRPGHALRPGHSARPPHRADDHAQRLGPYHSGRAEPRHRLCARHLRRRHGRAFRDRCRRQYGDAAARGLRRLPDALSRRAREDHGPRAFRARSLHRRGAHRRAPSSSRASPCRTTRTTPRPTRKRAWSGPAISSANWAIRSICAS